MRVSIFRSNLVHALLALGVAIASWSTSVGASAQSGVPIKEELFDFEDEAQNAGWVFDGGAGIDRGLGNASSGRNNGWIRGTTGWNALWRRVVAVGKVCRAHARLRSTPNLTGLYFSIVDGNTGAVLNENGPLTGAILTPAYRNIYYTAFTAYPRYDGQPFILRVGFWGNGQDAWAHVDSISFQCYAEL